MDRSTWSSGRGSVLPLLAVGVVLAGVLALGMGRLGSDAVTRAAAVTAADAAALAAAADGEAEARRVAARNGGRLVGLQWVGADVVVEVTVGPARAVARARRAWSALPWPRRSVGPRSMVPPVDSRG